VSGGGLAPVDKGPAQLNPTHEQIMFNDNLINITDADFDTHIYRVMALNRFYELFPVMLQKMKLQSLGLGALAKPLGVCFIKSRCSSGSS
jgi:hypothetical protein